MRSAPNHFATTPQLIASRVVVAVAVKVHVDA
jgi:hypothetical protein